MTRNHVIEKEISPEYGGSFLDLIIALLLLSFFGIALLEGRYRSLISLREISERLHRHLEHKALFLNTPSTCVIDTLAIHCDQNSPDQTIVFTGR
jgi:hypothetical protein